LKLKVKNQPICLLQVYAPNAVSEYHAFVDEVNDALLRVSPSESTVFIGISTHTLVQTRNMKAVIERHEVPGLNENGRYLLQLCCNNGLRIMNTFFQHRDVHKNTWYRPSMEQKSMIDFCIVLPDLFSDVLDIRVRRGTELSTDHYLVVCSLRISKPVSNRKSRKSAATYRRIKWEALEDKEVRKQFAPSMIAKFRQLPDESERIKMEWLLFRSKIIASAVECCGQKWLRVAGDSEKRTSWWNQDVKRSYSSKERCIQGLVAEQVII